MNEVVTGVAKGEIEEKRLYLPGLQLEATCPKCHAAYVRDFGDDYLSYPKVGEPEDLTLYCRNRDCDHEWKVRAQLDVTMKILGDTPACS